MNTPTNVDLIKSLADAYYRAVARSAANRSARDFGYGQADGLVTALALVTGRDRLVVTFRLWHGIPVGVDGDGWQVVNRAPVNNHPDMQLLLPDGRSIPVDERLAALGVPGGC